MARTFYRERIPMKAGAVEMIEYAVSKGIKLGIGTSNSRDLLQEVIGAHSIETHFQSIRTSCEVERGKPYPDIFLKVAEDLGVAPEKCLVFEDTHAGVLAAKRAGMKVIAVRDEISAPYEAEIRGDADAYIQSFEELFAV
jgi:HAD superfamily hydrolase (TIGR01509 family)